jgi:hypothetical protein
MGEFEKIDAILPRVIHQLEESQAMTFTRPHRKQNREDAHGKVRVQITLVGPNGRSTAKGNITQSFTVLGRVSEVSAAVGRALFDAPMEAS